MTTRFRTHSAPDDVWHILCDGWLFANWVVGSSRIREVDEHWPSEGSKFYHSVGVWPLLRNDFTEVLSADPGRMIELAAHAWPAGRARVRLTLVEIPEGCEIVMEEWVDTWPIKWVPKAVQEKLAAPRNNECLHRLALLAERRPQNA